MSSKTETEEQPQISIAKFGGVANLLAENTAQRNSLSRELHYKDIKLRASKEGHIATLGRLAKYEDVVEEVIEYAKKEGMFISCNSAMVGVQSTIGNYEVKSSKNKKVIKAHFTIYGHFIRKCNGDDEGPIFYKGNFLFKEYEETLRPFLKTDITEFTKLEDLYNLNLFG